MTDMLKELVQEIVKLNRQYDKLEQAYNELKGRYDDLERIYTQEHGQNVRFYKMIREDVVVSGVNIEEMIAKSREVVADVPEVVEETAVVEEKQDATADAVAATVNTDVVNNVNTDVKQVELNSDKKYKTSSTRREYMRKYMNERREKKEKCAV